LVVSPLSSRAVNNRKRKAAIQALVVLGEAQRFSAPKARNTVTEMRLLPNFKWLIQIFQWMSKAVS
jgi:hypothetical protein